MVAVAVDYRGSGGEEKERKRRLVTIRDDLVGMQGNPRRGKFGLAERRGVKL